MPLRPASRTTAVVLFVLSLIVLAAAAGAERPEPEVHGVFQGDEMYTLLPPDAIPAILEPEYVTGDEAAAQMTGEEPVMALARDGEAVAWSTWQLDHHEIVNDTFQGRPIAATW